MRWLGRLAYLSLLCLLAHSAPVQSAPGPAAAEIKDVHKRSSAQSKAEVGQHVEKRAVNAERAVVKREAHGGREGEGSATDHLQQLQKALEELQNLRTRPAAAHDDAPSAPEQQDPGSSSETSGDSSYMPGQQSSRDHSAGTDDGAKSRAIAYLIDYLNKDGPHSSAGSSANGADGHAYDFTNVLNALSLIKGRIRQLAQASVSEDDKLVKRIYEVLPEKARRETHQQSPATTGHSDDDEDMTRLAGILANIQKRKFSPIPGKRKFNPVPLKRGQETGVSSPHSELLSIVYRLTEVVETMAQQQGTARQEMHLLSRLVEELSSRYSSRK